MAPYRKIDRPAGAIYRPCVAHGDDADLDRLRTVCRTTSVSFAVHGFHGRSDEVCVTHRGDMGEKGIQFFIGVEDTILSKIIGSRYRPYALAPRLLVDRLDAAI